KARLAQQCAERVAHIHGEAAEPVPAPRAASVFGSKRQISEFTLARNFGQGVQLRLHVALGFPPHPWQQVPPFPPNHAFSTTASPASSYIGTLYKEILYVNPGPATGRVPHK